MKKKYSEVLKESLINFDAVTKHSSTVNDIVNFDGKGSLSTYKKANNVVSVLERMYHQEDNDLPMVQEGEETEIAAGTGPTDKIVPDKKEQDVKNVATKAVGAGHPSPQDEKEFEDTMIDATKDDKTVATESAESIEEMSSVPGEDDVLFEDTDLDSDSLNENLEHEPDHEAQGDDDRAEKIGEDGAKLANDATLGDPAIDGMEQGSKGVPEESKVEESVEESIEEMNEEHSSPSEKGEGAEIVKDENVNCEDDLERLPEDEVEPTEGEVVPDEGEEHEAEETPSEEEAEHLPGGEEEGEIDEVPGEEEVGGEEELEDNMDEVPGEEEVAPEAIPTEEVCPTCHQQMGAEQVPGEEEAPVLDVDKETQMRESIVSRDDVEESVVERLIREMKLETESTSDLDEIDNDDIDED